jgi:hypothetical protein
LVLVGVSVPAEAGAALVCSPWFIPFMHMSIITAHGSRKSSGVSAATVSQFWLNAKAMPAAITAPPKTRLRRRLSQLPEP